MAADRKSPAPQCRLPGAGPERRRSKRLEHPVAARLRPEKADGLVGELQAMVLDLSLHGVGLRSSVALEEGAIYRVVIGNGPLYLSARLGVISCHNLPDGTHRIGAEFR